MSTITTPAAAPQQAGVVASGSPAQTAGATPQTSAAPHPDPTPSKWEGRYKFTRRISLACLIVIGLVVAWSALSLRLWATDTAPDANKQPPPPPPGVTPEQLDQAVAKAVAPLKQEIENRDAQQRAALDRLVTLVGGYSLLIGLTVYFSFKSARDEADKQTKFSSEQLTNQIKFTNEQLGYVQKSAENQLTRNADEWKRFTERVWTDLPDMRAMQEGLRSLLFELEQIIPIEADWNDEESYKALSEDKRQEILISEATIAALPTLVSRDSPGNIASLARLYRALARFYFGRYKAEKLKVDSDRADAYVNRAIRLDTEHAGSYRLRGAIYLAQQRLTQATPLPQGTPMPPESKLLLDKAELDLRRALRKDANDLGAYYNLAIVLARQDHVKDGVDLIREALQPQQLENFPLLQKRKYLGVLMVNQACDLLTLAKAAQDPTEQAKLRDEVLGMLTQGLDLVSQLHSAASMAELKKSIDKEFAPGGDLEDLTQDEKTKVLTHQPASAPPANTQTITAPPATAQAQGPQPTT